MIDTVFWDFDGTLAERPSMWSEAILSSLDEIAPNHSIKKIDIVSHLQSGFPWHTPETPHRLCSSEAWWEFMGKKFAEVFDALGFSHNHNLFINMIKGSILDSSKYRMFDDVTSALEKLSQNGVTQHVLSNHIPELEKLVSDLGIRHYFGNIITSGLAGVEKPHPEIYGKAKGLTKSKRLWMIGDSYEPDYLAPSKHGFNPILIRKRHGDRTRFAADAIEAADMILISLGKRS